MKKLEVKTGWRITYVCSATMPFGVKFKMNNRPFPTRPKFIDADTASLESKKGEYLTA